MSKPKAAVSPASKKTVCPVTRAEFAESAEDIIVTIGDAKMIASAKEFSTRSLGWNLNGQSVVMVGGKPCKVQIGLNITIANSKEAE